MKIGDFVHDNYNGMNGLIIKRGTGITGARRNGRKVAFRDFVILYENGVIRTTFENDLEVISVSR